MGPQSKFHFSDWAGEEPIGRESNLGPFPCSTLPASLCCPQLYCLKTDFLMCVIGMLCSIAGMRVASASAPPLLVLVFLQKSDSPGVAAEGLGWSRTCLGISDFHSPSSSVISQ